MGGLVLVEPRELDRGQDLPSLHRRAAHRRELIDQRVDGRDQPIAAPPALVFLGAAAVDAIARPASGPAGSDSPQAHRARRPTADRGPLLVIGHLCGEEL